MVLMIFLCIHQGPPETCTQEFIETAAEVGRPMTKAVSSCVATRRGTLLAVNQLTRMGGGHWKANDATILLLALTELN